MDEINISIWLSIIVPVERYKNNTHPPPKFLRFGTFTANLPKNFDPRGVKYGEKTVIFKSLGPPDPTHPHLELFPNETVF